MTDGTSRDWFEAAWTFREDTLYPRLFGSAGPGIYPLNAELFTKVFGQSSCDPRWLSHGVLECPPNAQRASWLYVSSGLSNAWEAEEPNPEGPSGLGVEFIFQSSTQGTWAIALLQRMVAFQLLLNAGRFPGKGLLEVWHRVPLRGPIDGKTSEINSVMFVPSRDFGGIQQLPSGYFQFLELAGITQVELDFAKKNGSDALYKLLLEANAAITDPVRASISLP